MVRFATILLHARLQASSTRYVDSLPHLHMQQTIRHLLVWLQLRPQTHRTVEGLEHFLSLTLDMLGFPVFPNLGRVAIATEIARGIVHSLEYPHSLPITEVVE